MLDAVLEHSLQNISFPSEKVTSLPLIYTENNQDGVTLPL